MKAKPYISLIIILSVLFVSCNQSDQNEQIDTPVSGKDTVYVEDILLPYFSAAKPRYDSVFEHADITLISVNARRGMSLLFADSANCVILSRDYLQDEDSIRSALKLPFKQIEIAKDGLVFFVNTSIPIDTLNIMQLQDFVNGSSINTVQKLTTLDERLIIPSMQSSEYAALLHYFSIKDKPLPIKTTIMEDRKQLKKHILSNNAIAIGMMSDVLKDSSVKPIRIGYVDSSKRRIPPQIVHPGFIVQNMYPLIVPIFAYMKNDKQNLAWGFATFMEKDPEVQRILLKQGIVPTHARYNLIRED
ncbi:MAG: substrate-binding domain-containing protein [Ignavibacteria bacterium]|jgi:ABC-type phosphate transport system substrate-binding protein